MAINVFNFVSLSSLYFYLEKKMIFCLSFKLKKAKKRVGCVLASFNHDSTSGTVPGYYFLLKQMAFAVTLSIMSDTIINIYS